MLAYGFLVRRVGTDAVHPAIGVNNLVCRGVASAGGIIVYRVVVRVAFV